MKKLLTILLLAGALSACNNHKPDGNKNTTIPIEADEHQREDTSEKLVLNDGAKWKVDIGTNNNVNYLQVILKKFDNGSDKSLTAYKNTHDDLQRGIDKMIAECKMTGPDHHALHKWLEPLMAQVAALKQAATIPDAAESLNAIRTQLSLFNQYFEI